MTEEEAKTKWCPAARVDSTGANRPNPGPNCDTAAGWPPCVGSACMAWRWHGHVDRATGRLLPGLTDIEDNESDDHVAAVGYCGLAGKP